MWVIGPGTFRAASIKDAPARVTPPHVAHLYKLHNRLFLLRLSVVSADPTLISEGKAMLQCGQRGSGSECPCFICVLRPFHVWPSWPLLRDLLRAGQKTKACIAASL